MRALAKVRPAPGLELIDVEEPAVRPGCVKLKIQAVSVCGTDLHIDKWDGWAASRIHPTRIIGHEFCGTITELGEGVDQRHLGQYVASESHIVPLTSAYLKAGLGHVAPETTILGVDVDGGFAEYAVIPWTNAVPTDVSVPPHIAAFQDALGNGVHTAMDGPVEGCDILITGMGPIGLFAAAVCKALGARTVVGTEVSPYRIGLAKKMGLDLVINPAEEPADELLKQACPEGFHGVLEMSGHPSAIQLGVDHVRPGGRMSMLGVFPQNVQSFPINEVIFKGIQAHGIVGRRLWDTWDQMQALLVSGKLHLDPVVTHVMPYEEFRCGLDMMLAGQAGKVVFTFP